MIKKESIRQTAICYWSKEDSAFVVESPLLPRTAGIGATPESARKHFQSMLDGIYNHLAIGKLHGYNKRGRPKKGGLQFHTQVRPKTKSYITELAKKLDISLGEVLDYLCVFHKTSRHKELAEQQEIEPVVNPKFIRALSDLLNEAKKINKLKSV